VSIAGGIFKRLLVGRPQRSDRLGESLLPKRIALPVFASDALSSVAYATEQILLVLSAGGLALLHFTWYAAAGVAFLMLVVVASYRQNVHAYPSGGGDYEVASVNLGRRAGVTVASALMVDYVLTVAVSVSSGVANITSAVQSLQGHEVVLAVAIVLVIMVLNLRGVRESGTAFAIPTYAFIAGIAVLIAVGFSKLFTGHQLVAESAGLHVVHPKHYVGFALVFLLLRSFASGCTALTGVEAISNGVPAFRKPKSKNAATTLAMLGALAVTMFIAITALAIRSHVHVADNATALGLPAGSHQKTVIAQIGSTVFGGDHAVGFYYLQAVTALILVLAANTAFNGFPVLASILARDGYLPRQLHTRGDRLAFSFRAAAQRALNRPPGDVARVRHGAGGFADNAQQLVGVDHAECLCDGRLFLRDHAGRRSTGNVLQRVADVDQPAICSTHRRSGASGNPRRRDRLECVHVAQSAACLLQVRFKQERHFAKALGTVAHHLVQLRQPLRRARTPLTERMLAQSGGEIGDAGNVPRVQHAEGRFHVGIRDRDRLGDCSHGVVEFPAGVPDGIPNLVGDLHDVGPAVMQHHDVEVAARAHFPAPIATNGDQRHAVRIA